MNLELKTELYAGLLWLELSFKPRLRKVLKTGFVVLIQYRQSITLCYASPCRI